MNSGIPHSAEFLGVHFKKRHKVLKHSLQRGSANGVAKDRGVVFSPWAEQGQRGQIYIQCVLISKTSSPWLEAEVLRTNELCRTRIQLTCPPEDSGTHEEPVFWGAEHKVGARLSSQNKK